MLDLRDAELQLVPVLARDEAELPEQVAQPVPPALADPQRVAAPARGRLVEERARLVQAHAEQRDDPRDGVALRLAVTWRVHAGGSCAAAGGVRAWRRARRRLRLRRRRRPPR